MTAQPELEYEAVIRGVRPWPVRRKYELVHDLLRMLEPNVAAEDREQRRIAVRELRGALKSKGPPPTDAEVKQWLEEERLKKYG